MLYSNLGNENSDAGHIKFSSGPQVSQPWFKSWFLLLDLNQSTLVDSAVESEPEQFWMGGVGAKNFSKAELEPESWDLVPQL